MDRGCWQVDHMCIIVNVPTAGTTYTDVDNIMAAAPLGQEEGFLRVVGVMLERIRPASVLPSPDKET